MAKETAAKIMKRMEENDIKFVKLWFTDILGFLKSFSVPKEEMEKAFDEGIGFDGSSIEGFVRIDESDMVAIPDPSTFAILPWRPKEKGVARVFCDIVTPDGKPFEGDPRYVLKKNLEKAKKLGFTYYTGPELEYFYFKDSHSTEVLDRGDTLTSSPGTKPSICGGKRFFSARPWVSGSNTRIMKWHLPSMKSTCGMKTPSPWRTTS